MESITFTDGHRESFTRLCKLYFTGLGEDWGDETLERVVSHLVGLQSDFKFFINLCILEGNPIGFIIAQIDEEGNPWCLKPGYGFIRELYVMDAYRRMGYGMYLYQFAEEKLKEYGAQTVYLAASLTDGEPFWEAVGFRFTGEVHNNNGCKIYEKSI